jgi:hypothetical protein
MERQKNYLQSVIRDSNILPIENEMLHTICDRLHEQLGAMVTHKEKLISEVMFDSYLLIAGNSSYLLKINLSPDLPNFWKELCEFKFDFHPEIVACSGEDDEFKFICYKTPRGSYVHEISNYILSPKLGLEKKFADTMQQMHDIKISESDDTVKVLNSFMPREAMMISRSFPVSELFSTTKLLFSSVYESNLSKCGVCHFDLCPENIIYTGSSFKLLNFEYAANANTYVDLLLAKETLNVSDEAMKNFLSHYSIDRQLLNNYRLASQVFNFAYFNSKIISQYMTFGNSNFIKLKYLINKSKQSYEKIYDRLFVPKSLDNQIRTFYHLWK